MRMDNLTGTGRPSSPRSGVSFTECRRVAGSTEPSRKDDSSRSASSATFGVSMLTTGIPLPRSTQTRLAQTLASGRFSNPRQGASQQLVTAATRSGFSSGRSAQSSEVVTSVLDISPCGRSLHRPASASQTFSTLHIDRNVTHLSSFCHHLRRTRAGSPQIRALRPRPQPDAGAAASRQP